MKWIELSVKSPPEFVEPLSQIFHRYGHGGVAVEEDGGYNPDEGETPLASAWVTVKTYLPVDATTQKRRSQIDLGVRLVAHLAPLSPLQEKEVDEEEWQSGWKEHFHVLHIGKKIVISPTWREYSPAPSDIVISLDPGMAFGTGHHPTTRMCLERLEELVKPGMDVLDIGSGSGILSIAAAKLGARKVFGLEIDSVAATVAEQNVKLNRAAETIRIIHGTLPHSEVHPRSFDIAVANISAKVVCELAAELVHAVRPGGKVVASGILDENKGRVVDALALAGSMVEQTFVDGDWVALVAAVGQSGNAP